jgi:hypothetical protein
VAEFRRALIECDAAGNIEAPEEVHA